MKKMIAFILVLVMYVGGCFNQQHHLWGYKAWESKTGMVFGNGIEGREVREVSGFTGVVVSGQLKVQIRQGAKEGVELVGDENVLGVIKTEVSGGELKIYSSGNYKTQNRVVVMVTVLDLKRVQLSGAVEGAVDGVNSDSFSARISGSGRLEIVGKTDKFVGRVSGSGWIEGMKLIAKVGHVRVSGSGRVQVFAEEKLTARVSGSGEVLYGGVKDADGRVSGSGSVRRVD